MKLNQYKQRVVWASLFLAFLALAACKKEEYSEDYDISWPLPTIASVTPETADIEAQVTVTGTNLDKTNVIRIGTTQAEIVSKSATEVVLIVPRVVDAGTINLTTSFKRDASSEVVFTPTFPHTEITDWPQVLSPGGNFTLKGTNVDLITEASLNGQTIEVDGSTGEPDEILISTAGISLAVDDVITITITARGGITGDATSPEITITEPSVKFEALDPVVLFDFENATDIFQMQAASGVTPASTIDGSSLDKARGNHYFSLTASQVNSWQDMGFIEITQPVDVSNFNQPHLSFLVNTNGNEGYFQLEDGQGNWYHFLQGDDNYKFGTQGWEWRSYDLNEILDGRDLDLANFQARLFFKSGNVGSGSPADFEMNLDQVMVTDGPINIRAVAFDFEDGVNGYSGNANSGINLGGVVPLQGNNYLTVTKESTGAWDWHGDAGNYTPVDLSSFTCPVVSFWVNTNGNFGNIQIETTQNGTKWGSNPFAEEGYTIQTNGWVLYNFEMTKLFTENWGGGTATEFDPQGIIDYIKIGFSTGNQDSGTYEINIDAFYISDGPVF